MIQLAPQMRIYVAIDAVDFRKGIDGLAQVCRNKLNDDPFSGHLFLFRNKKGTAVKVLAYDGQGFWLCQKRLSQGRLRWWPSKSKTEQIKKMLAVNELQILLWNGNPEQVHFAPPWRKIR